MILAFHFSYKTATKASPIEKAAKEGRRGQLAEKVKTKETEGILKLVGIFWKRTSG